MNKDSFISSLGLIFLLNMLGLLINNTMLKRNGKRDTFSWLMVLERICLISHHYSWCSSLCCRIFINAFFLSNSETSLSFTFAVVVSHTDWFFNMYLAVHT
jgi:Kef-type K+ transport system membrane component KefB